MRPRILASTCLALTISGCAMGQNPNAAQAQPAPHPPGRGPMAAAPAPGTPLTPEALERQEKAMQDMHQRMLAAKTPAERAALMDEHMKLMQSGMHMMGQMRGRGGMMGMREPMERRMDMMEHMMQMMVDREATVSPR